MKLSTYAKSKGISYKTAWRMWKRGRKRKTECIIKCLKEEE